MIDVKKVGPGYAIDLPPHAVHASKDKTGVMLTRGEAIDLSVKLQTALLLNEGIKSKPHEAETKREMAALRTEFGLTTDEERRLACASEPAKRPPAEPPMPLHPIHGASDEEIASFKERRAKWDADKASETDWAAKARMADDLIRSASDETERLRIVEKCLRWAEQRRPDAAPHLNNETVMKASDFKKLSFLEQVRAYIRECKISLQVEKLDPAILSDIGTEGIVFDGYVVYLAKGDYEFGKGPGQLVLPGYHVWTEASVPSTLPPSSNVIELLTTQSLEEAVRVVLDAVIHERVSGLSHRLLDSENED